MEKFFSLILLKLKKTNSLNGSTKNNENFLAFLRLAKNNYPYVRVADGKKVIITAASGFAKFLRFNFIFETKNEMEKAKLFSWLRDKDVYFSYGREWSPAEVFEYLRKKDLIDGNFKVIAWKNPKQFHIYQK